MNKEKILILGADGFIGSNLAKSLQKENRYKIFSFDIFKDGISRNLDSFNKDLIMVQGNFLNREDIKKAVEGIDYVFHFISLTSPGSSAEDPFIDIDTNIKGAITLLEECVSAKVKKIIFSSTGGAIYGDQDRNKYSENDVTNPVSPYAIAKLTIEKYLEYYRIQHGLPYLILRYSNPFGPHQNLVGSQGIVPIFLNLIRENKPITIYGDGENIRDYIYIDDAVMITKNIFSKKTKHNLYNVGSGKGVTINELVKIIRKVTKKNVKISRLPKRAVDIRKIILNTRRIQNELPKYNLTSLEIGIKKTWDWVRDQSKLK